MNLEDYTPGDTILVARGSLVFTATVTATRSIPDSQGRRHEYVDFTPNAPHENLVYRYCVPGEIIARTNWWGDDNDPED